MPHWPDILLYAELPAQLLTCALAAGFFGGFVRGYSGFGFALAAVPILTFALPPVVAIPAVLPIELAIGIATLPSERGHVAWQPCAWLIAGTVAGTPLGLTVLATIPAQPMRIVIGILVLIAVLILWQRPALSNGAPRAIPLAGAGFISGLLNGGTAMSGPPAIVALLGSNLQTRPARATLIAFIAFSAAFGLAIAASRGLLTQGSGAISALLLPGAVLGGVVGLITFSRTADRHYRRASLALLGLVSTSALISTALSLIRANQY